ncbi:MAG: type II toxin-antitoxin system HicB family antitoxin [candidate division Zixibacteria bacterium]|nr:type II toxin-antitoxin system HicB family antitoxin [Candidatus Tariuqbacter arcticus]
MKLSLQIIINQDEEGIYIVSCPALKGCRSYGRTLKEAQDNIQEAIQAHIEYIINSSMV